jgi:hypothetical protein
MGRTAWCQHETGGRITDAGGTSGERGYFAASRPQSPRQALLPVCSRRHWYRLHCSVCRNEHWCKAASCDTQSKCDTCTGDRDAAPYVNSAPNENRDATSDRNGKTCGHAQRLEVHAME